MLSILWLLEGVVAVLKRLVVVVPVVLELLLDFP
jgi:hypothetical protein